MDTTKEMESTRRFVSSYENYNEYCTFDIFYTSVHLKIHNPLIIISKYLNFPNLKIIL